MKKLISIFIFSCLIFSCGENKTVSIPPTILPKEKMAAVIADIHLAEAEANIHMLPDSSSGKKISYGTIFEKHSVTKQQYEESLSFYISHPELLDEIYEAVLNELSKMQGEAKKQQ